MRKVFNPTKSPRRYYISNSEFITRKGTNELIIALEELAKEARERLWIAVPWFYTVDGDPWIESYIKLLIQRCKEGVDVRVFLRPDISNHKTINQLNLSNVKVFSKKEITRHIHTKMVMNERMALILTANITEFDLYRNLNTGFLITKPDEVSNVCKDFEKLIESEVLKRQDYVDVPIRDVVPEYVSEFFEERFPLLNPVQVEVASKILNHDENLLIGTETGTGKTLMAEMAIWKTLQGKNNTRALYIAPLKAITIQKEEDWKKFAERGFPFYKITGDEETIDENKINKARIIITTGEKWDSLTRKPQRFPFTKEIDLVIIDEIHIIDDEIRGPTTEVLLARLKRTIPNARLIGLSATMRNIDLLAKWLNAEYYKNSEYRPVPLYTTFVTYPDTSYYNIAETVKDKLVLDSVKMLLDDTTETGGRGKILIFTGTRRKAENTAEKIATEFNLSNYASEYASKASNFKLKTLMEKGVAFIHAGLSLSDRKLALRAFDEGPIDVLVSTTALAWGVNVSARTVIIRDIRVAMQKEIDFIDLKQMIGRAGRKGRETIGYAIIIVPYKDRQMVESAIIEGKNIESKLERYLPDHINAEINLGYVKDWKSLEEWFTSTFWYYQNYHNRSDWRQLLQGQLELLISKGFVVEEGGIFRSSKLGKLTSDWCVHVRTAIKLLSELPKFNVLTSRDLERAELLLLRIITTSEEDLSLLLRSDEEQKEIQDFKNKYPIFKECSDEKVKVAYILLKLLLNKEKPNDEEYQAVRQAITLLGYFSEISKIYQNISGYVIARDLAKRLQYYSDRGSGQLLNLIWYSTPNTDEKEQQVRKIYRWLVDRGIRSPLQLLYALTRGRLSRELIPNELVYNVLNEFPHLDQPKLDGKYLGEEIRLTLGKLSERTNITVVLNGETITLSNQDYLNLTRLMPKLFSSPGLKNLWIEVFAHNKLGWDYAKIKCELVVLPSSWKPSVLEELTRYLETVKAEIRPINSFVRIRRVIKKFLSYSMYASEFIENTEVVNKIGAILTRDVESDWDKVYNIIYYIKRYVNIISESGGEPRSTATILYSKFATPVEFAVVICSLIRGIARSPQLNCNLVEVNGGRFGRHVLPTLNKNGVTYLLDIFGEVASGLQVKGKSSASYKIVDFQTLRDKGVEESRMYEWVNSYSGDGSSKRFEVRNYDDADLRPFYEK
ncbi:MAG: DEAD/DEAH box helicase [Nitrososphaerota archaeon]